MQSLHLLITDVIFFKEKKIHNFVRERKFLTKIFLCHLKVLHYIHIIKPIIKSKYIGMSTVLEYTNQLNFSTYEHGTMYNKFVFHILWNRIPSVLFHTLSSTMLNVRRFQKCYIVQCNHISWMLLFRGKWIYFITVKLLS